MKRKYIIFLIGIIFFSSHLSLSAVSANVKPDNHVNIVVSADATKQEIKAADQLKTYLKEIYPGYLFAVTTLINEDNYTVRIARPVILAAAEQMTKDIPTNEEGFLIRRLNEKNVIIASHSAKGLFNAVYSLVEKLGVGFYLSSEVKALPKKKLEFKEWELSDFPLQQERIVFNWHNFLSGCTGWNYEDWCSWIDQSAKMRYNSIMVHAYGNNPMFSFEYNGQKKVVGYLTTSQSGRDWGAQHVNDVRRLPGGKIFSASVMGSTAALVPDNQRSEAATNLMSRVFEHSGEMAMKLNFAIDVDTWPANPKNIIETLPQSSRIKLREQDIVNPETPEGYQYYKAQVKSLLTNYPQISTITVWIRDGRSLWNDMTSEQFPDSWLKEWKQLIEKHPELGKYKHGPSIFTSSKVVTAFQKALKEINRENISVAFGSWNLEFVPYSDLLMPSDCPLIFLEEMVNFDSSERRKVLSEIGKSRKVIPVFYGHHDDHRYMGRPYAPFPNFNDLLTERKVAGFGLLHWTTRPLDLLFKSLDDQVWEKSENKTLTSTLSDYCRTTFGSSQKALDQYMSEWINRGPMFGRETQDHFFDLGKQIFGEKLEPTDVTIAGIKSRTALLKSVNQSDLSEMGKKMYRYYASMEQFYLMLFQNQDKFNQAYAMLGRQSMDSANVILQSVTPEKTIEIYTAASTILPITTGEKALIVSMGTRWLPDFVNLKQRARMTDICYKFEATHHDTLAQQPGINTYFVDRSKILWSCLGEKELKAGVCGNFDKQETPALAENSLTYLRISKPLNFPLITIGKNNLAPGKYRVELKYKPSADGSPCKLNLVSRNGKIPLQTVLKDSSRGLSVISSVIGIKECQKCSIEIDPGNADLLLTNLVIRPLN